MLRWFLNTFVRRSSMVTRLLFGIKTLKGERIHWDFTTLVLKRALLRTVSATDKVLEIGTGPYALLSLSIARKKGCAVVATDINESYVSSAREAVKANMYPVTVQESDLFAGIDETYDVIFSNTLYIPRSVGAKLGLRSFHDNESDWCGGETGYEYIQNFLVQAAEHLQEQGTILLGYNRRYLNESKIRDLCIQYSYKVVTTSQMVCNPGIVLHLQRQSSRSKSGQGTTAQ